MKKMFFLFLLIFSGLFCAQAQDTTIARFKERAIFDSSAKNILKEPSSLKRELLFFQLEETMEFEKFKAHAISLYFVFSDIPYKELLDAMVKGEKDFTKKGVNFFVTKFNKKPFTFLVYWMEASNKWFIRAVEIEKNSIFAVKGDKIFHLPAKKPSV